MKNRELEDQIERAFTRAVPDVLEAVLSDCDKQKGSVIPMTKKVQSENKVQTPRKNRPTWVKRFGGIAAAFVLLVGCAVGYGSYHQSHAVDSVVSLDVNPSVEIQVNRKDEVLDVVPLNEDGKKVIGDMDFAGSDLDVTVNALIGSMLQNGYLSELANSILISVENDDAQRGAQLQEQLTQEINNLLQTNSFSGAVLSQTVSDDSALRDKAEQYGITLGKAQLIQQITQENSRYTFADLVPLSINELNLLRTSSQSTTQSEAQVKSVGSASDKAYIGSDRAKEVAFERAGVSASKAANVTVELDYEDGVMVYQVEFKYGGYEYDCDVNATTGAVVKYEKEADDDSQKKTTQSSSGTSSQNNNTSTQNGTSSTQSSGNTASSSGISKAKAKEIALSHAGVSASKISDYSIEQDTENGIKIYEIDFKAGGYEYEYDINATTGSVMRCDKEADDDHEDHDDDHDDDDHDDDEHDDDHD